MRNYLNLSDHTGPFAQQSIELFMGRENLRIMMDRRHELQQQLNNLTANCYAQQLRNNELEAILDAERKRNMPTAAVNLTGAGEPVEVAP